MKHLAILMLFLLAIPSFSLAQPTIGVYSDTLPYFHCNIDEPDEFTEVFFNLDIRVLENGQAKGEFSTARNFKGKDYGKESYRKKRWGNNTDYNTKQYAGNTDGSQFKSSPHYVQKQALAGSRDSRFNRSKFGTNSVAKSNAQETNSTSVKKGQSGYVSSRGDYGDTRVMSKKEYAELSVRQTNSLLGRE